MGSSPSILDPVILPFIKGSLILDVGCGFGRWACLCTFNFWESKSYEFSKPIKPEIIGVDAYQPNLELAQSLNLYTELHQVVLPELHFPDNYFETVLAIEIIEHLDKAEGKKLIESLIKVAAQRVIISTPNYNAIREAHEDLTGTNDYDAHKSYWSRREFRDLGFKIYGAGFRLPRLFYRIGNKLSLVPFLKNVEASLSSTTLFFPVFAEQIVAVYDKPQT